jgi:hypothetical protein
VITELSTNADILAELIRTPSDWASSASSRTARHADPIRLRTKYEPTIIVSQRSTRLSIRVPWMVDTSQPKIAAGDGMPTKPLSPPVVPSARMNVS